MKKQPELLPQVGGYVIKVEDVVQLSTYDEMYESLCLDYLGSAYKPTTDNSIGVIRYTIDEASEITIPYSVNVKYPDASSSNVKLFEKDVKELIITGVQKKCNMVW